MIILGQSHDIEGNVKMKVSSSNLTLVYIGPLAQKNDLSCILSCKNIKKLHLQKFDSY